MSQKQKGKAMSDDEFFEAQRKSRVQKPGTVSNAIITARNGGVKHQFIDDIGGCSANYK